MKQSVFLCFFYQHPVYSSEEKYEMMGGGGGGEKAKSRPPDWPFCFAIRWTGNIFFT